MAPCTQMALLLKEVNTDQGDTACRVSSTSLPCDAATGLCRVAMCPLQKPLRNGAAFLWEETLSGAHFSQEGDRQQGGWEEYEYGVLSILCFSVGVYPLRSDIPKVLSISSALQEKTSGKRIRKAAFFTSIHIKECHRRCFLHPVSTQNYLALQKAVFFQPRKQNKTEKAEVMKSVISQ